MYYACIALKKKETSPPPSPTNPVEVVVLHMLRTNDAQCTGNVGSCPRGTFVVTPSPAQCRAFRRNAFEQKITCRFGVGFFFPLQFSSQQVFYVTSRRPYIHMRANGREHGAWAYLLVV